MESDLNLLVNAESLVPPLTGIGFYTRHLLHEYARVLSRDDLYCFADNRLAGADECLGRVDRHSPGAVKRQEQRLALLHRIASRTSLPYRIYQHRNQRAFRRATRALPEGTLYHEPNYILKPFPGAAVVTVHDLSVFHYPQFHPKSRVRHLERNLPRSLDRAAHVITDSELVRHELIERFRLDAEKVSAVHLGVSSAFTPVAAADLKRVLEPYGLSGREYLLCVSTFEPRKNLAGLLDAFSGLSPERRQRHPLVLVGPRGWLSGDTEARLVRLVERGEIVRLGYVPRDHLPALYSGACAFAFPSVYEGFGLPVLEAMACGTAVVTGTGTAMAEVTDGAALLVNPRDTDALRAGILQLLHDPKGRDRLAEAGRRRAADLTWHRCAQRHLDIFKSVHA